MTATHQENVVPTRRKLAALGLGTVSALVSLELVLVALHLLFAPDSRAGSATVARQEGERRIMCMGDSNTFGVHLEPEESYPGRLQSYLDLEEDSPWTVINLGYPGQNTAQMRARLAENLDAYEPEILILFGGVNNNWSPAMGHLWSQPDNEEGADDRSLLERSRAYCSLRMIFVEGKIALSETAQPTHQKKVSRPGDHAAPGVGGAVRGEGFGDIETVDAKTERTTFTTQQVRAGILTDLRRIKAMCSERGIELVLGQYWSINPWVDERINTAIDLFARESNTPVIPLTAGIRSLVSEFGARAVLFGDSHANATGNREVARLALLTLLDTGLLEEREAWRKVPTTASMLEGTRPDPTTIEVLERGESSVRVELTGPRGTYYALELAALIQEEGGATAALTIPREVANRLRAPLKLPGGEIPKAQAVTESTLDLPPEGEIEEALELAPGSIVGWRITATFGRRVGGAQVVTKDSVDIDSRGR